MLYWLFSCLNLVSQLVIQKTNKQTKTRKDPADTSSLTPRKFFSESERRAREINTFITHNNRHLIKKEHCQ
uniref:Uncharacterized protein n=1 Tax=Anguilla anguilla TaxID=7936 RepID=A0A0E9UH32_ANGAN